MTLDGTLAVFASKKANKDTTTATTAAITTPATTILATTTAATIIDLSASQQQEQQGIVWDVEKWVDLRLDRGFRLSLVMNNNNNNNDNNNKSPGLLCVSGGAGKARLFEVDTLKHVGTLPLPHIIPNNKNNINKDNNKVYPDVISCCLHPQQSSIVLILSDRSIIVWQVNNNNNARTFTLKHSLLHHFGVVWDIVAFPLSYSPSLVDCSFVTCSEDNTVRLWSFPTNNNNNNTNNDNNNDEDNDVNDDDNNNKLDDINSIEDDEKDTRANYIKQDEQQRNNNNNKASLGTSGLLYSDGCMRNCLFVNNDFVQAAKALVVAPSSKEQLQTINDNQTPSKGAIRCLQLMPLPTTSDKEQQQQQQHQEEDEQQRLVLAAGDRGGNLFFYDISFEANKNRNNNNNNNNKFLCDPNKTLLYVQQQEPRLLGQVQAHNKEVLSMHFVTPNNNENNNNNKNARKHFPYLLATRFVFLPFCVVLLSMLLSILFIYVYL